MKVEYKRAMSKSETRVKPQDSLTETPAGTQLVLPQTRASNVLSPSFAYMVGPAYPSSSSSAALSKRLNWRN